MMSRRSQCLLIVILSAFLFNSLSSSWTFLFLVPLSSSKILRLVSLSLKVIQFFFPSPSGKFFLLSSSSLFSANLPAKESKLFHFSLVAFNSRDYSIRHGEARAYLHIASATARKFQNYSNIFVRREQTIQMSPS